MSHPDTEHDGEQRASEQSSHDPHSQKHGRNLHSSHDDQDKEHAHDPHTSDAHPGQQSGGDTHDDDDHDDDHDDHDHDDGGDHDDDDHDDDHDDHDHDDGGDDDDDDDDDDHPGNGHIGQTGNPRRPGKTVGTDRGRSKDPTPLTRGDLTTKHPPNSWVGPRKDLFLPFLFMRANPGDVGTRLKPNGSRELDVFWESPDVLIMAGVEPAHAPPLPPQLGQTALAGQPNTVYAHVWNFGQAQASQVVVEFYWCDPSLGIGPSSAHLIGQTMISLGARGSGRAHALVKCPEAWTPTFLNGGHECLLVRVWDVTSDALGTPPWDASLNRHIGQRNIHVVPALGGQMLMAAGAGAPVTPVLNTPLILKVGPLYRAPAQVNVTRVVPNNMPWLQLHTGVRGQFPQQAAPTGTPVLSRPNTIGGGMPTGGASDQQHVTGDDQQIAFTTSDAAPGPGQAHVYRVSASQGGQIFGGYTVVLIGG